MNITEAITTLNQHPNKTVIIGEAPGHEEYDPDYEGMFLSANVDSSRGDYSELAITPSETPTVGLLIAAGLNDAVGRTFYGYKGGEYMMRTDTCLWVAPYGDAGWRLDDIMVDGDILKAVLGDW